MKFFAFLILQVYKKMSYFFTFEFLCHFYSAKNSTDFVDENPQGFESKVVSFFSPFPSLYLIYFQEHFTEHEADGSRVVVWAHKQAS